MSSTASTTGFNFVHPSDRQVRIGRGRHVAPRALLRAAVGTVEGRLLSGLTAGGVVMTVLDMIGAF